MFPPCNVNLKLMETLKRERVKFVNFHFPFVFFLFSALFELDEDLLREFIIANLSFSVRKAKSEKRKASLQSFGN